MSPTRFRCATSLRVLDDGVPQGHADGGPPSGGAKSDWREIRTLASEETGALNQRLRPLGHPAKW